MRAERAQAARDPLFYACLTVALQDSIWAISRPNAGDLCLRCHFTEGWTEDRSDPVNASAMTGSDFDGVQCDLCHSQFDPFFEDRYSGAREGSDWAGYWDEATSAPSTAAAATRTLDRTATATVRFYNGTAFFSADYRPVATGYSESGSGQYFLSVPKNKDKRASFADASARHSFLYSRYHKSRDLCATCHDVSNPALANLAASSTNSPLPSETAAAHSYFHVERTFSEFMCSAYGSPGGSAGTGPFAPGQLDTSHPRRCDRQLPGLPFPRRTRPRLPAAGRRGSSLRQRQPSEQRAAEA